MMKKIVVGLFVICAALGNVFSQDHWSKMPAFPVTCYTENDAYHKNLAQVRQELEKKIEDENKKAQSKVNGMSEAEKQKMAMEMAMKYQTMSPQEIMKMQNEQMALVEQQQQVQQAATEVESRYREIEESYRQEQQALDQIMNEYNQLPDGEGTPDWAIKKGDALMQKYEQKYESICAKYFTADDAQFKLWLADYKKYIMDVEIPMNKATAETQYKQYGISSDGSAAEYDGMKKYADRCHSIYSMRKQYKG